jgi:TolB protein
LVLLALLLLPCTGQARVYITVEAPQRSLPMAVSPFSGPLGGELAQVVSQDLLATGLFVLLQRPGHPQAPGEPFRAAKWAPTGVEVVLRGTVRLREGHLLVEAHLWDVLTGAEILAKSYRAARRLLRPLGHRIAQDVYEALTGTPGPFTAKLVFVGEAEGGPKDFYLADWDGRRARPLGLKEELLLPARFSPDGEKLLYSAARGGRWAVYVLELRSMRERLLFSDKGVSLAGDISARGEVVLSSSRAGSPDLYLLTPEGKLKRLTWGPGIEVSPVFDPQGRRLAFVSDQGGSPQIYIMSLDDYNIRRITFRGSYNTSPCWSPDGKRLVFTGRYEGRNQVFSIGADGSDLRLLTTEGNNEQPCYSPDGRFIVFSSDREGDKAIYLMRADGKDVKRISPPGLRAYGPRYGGIKFKGR